MFSKRNSNKQKTKRKREKEKESSDEDSTTVVRSIKEVKKINHFSTGNATKKTGVVSDAGKVESSREIVPQQYAGDATYETQIDTEADRDARAILEKNIRANLDGSVEDSKIYRGQAMYKNYITKNESQIGMNKYTGTQGPIRAQTWARSICRFDYQPDICKDYKETGFCGFGDSCKFLHDRGDYKTGWEIEREFKEEQKKKQLELLENGGQASKEDSDNEYLIHSDDDEQFACTICRGPFRNAIETLCGHFFCEECALNHFKTSMRCFNCKKQTNGVFNACKKLRLKEKEEIQENTQDNEEETEKPKGSWSVVS